MEANELQAALDMFANPQLLRAQLEKDLSEKGDGQATELPTEDISAELLKGIAESLDEVKPQYQAIRQQLVKKHSVEHRDMAAIMDLTGKAYGVVKDHWAEIYFILNMLNKKGYLDKIKKKASLKPFFDTLFDKK